MKKIIVVGPCLSRSGYGEMARNAIKALLTQPGDYDIYIQNTSWGATGNIVNKNNPDYTLMTSLIRKTLEEANKNNNQIYADISLQIGLPTEWKKLAPFNIGYTAGIETNFVSGQWYVPSQAMDKIIVISEHAKNSFVNTMFGNQHGSYKITVPIEVVHFPYKNLPEKNLELDLEYDFNFLSVCQWGPRKNLEQTIVNFIEEFKNDEVGLVIKTNNTTDSLLDKEICEKRLKNILNNFPDRKCKVYLLHGYLSDSQMESLYKNPKIKAIVSTTHGEGFGLPLFEATKNELPVIATDWSGHLDFLSIEGKKMFAKIDFELKPIAKENVWPGVLEEGTSWAYPIPNSVKGRMREVYKDYPRFKSWAKKLAIYNKEVFTEEKIYNKFTSLFLEAKKVVEI